MGFENPILAGEELIRPGIRSEDYEEGLQGWRVGRDGNAEFNEANYRGPVSGPSGSFGSLSAETFDYKGDDLEVVLDRFSTGLVGYAVLDTAPGISFAATATALIQIPVTMRADRQNRVNIDPFFARSSTTNARWYMAYRYRLASAGDVVYADPGNVILQETSHPVAAANLTASGNALMTVPADGEYNVCLFGGAISGTQTVDVAKDIIFYVEEVGPKLASTGKNRFTVGAPAAKTLKTVTLAPLSSRTYDDNGMGNYGGLNERMYQGFYSGNGDHRSYVWYPTGAGTTLLDMIGVSDADTVYIDAYFYFRHWYNFSGGTAVLGWHGNTVVSDDNPALGGGLYDRKRTAYSQRGQGIWTALKGTAVADAIRAGTFRGMTLGNNPNPAGLGFYGYADGQSGVYPPKMRVKYYK